MKNVDAVCYNMVYMKIKQEINTTTTERKIKCKEKKKNTKKSEKFP